MNKNREMSPKLSEKFQHYPPNREVGQSLIPDSYMLIQQNCKTLKCSKVLFVAICQYNGNIVKVDMPASAKYNIFQMVIMMMANMLITMSMIWR